MTSEWITANAGSGKTTALTRRVVRLLLLGVAPEHILCITYTKAAASEMRHRVIDLLRHLLLDDDTTCQTRITEILGVAATPAQLTHARNLLGQVLDSPTGGIELTTIHGFCQSILRRFPVEAGIAPHFTVLDDAASEEALSRSKHALLTGLESAEPILADAIALIGARGGETRFESLARDIISKRQTWEEIWRSQSPESLHEHLYEFHGLENETTQEALDTWLCECLTDAEITSIRAQLPTMLAHTKKTEQKYAQGFAAWLEAQGQGRRTLIPQLCKLILTDKETLRADLTKLENYEGPIARLSECVQRYRTQTAALTCAEETFAIAMFAHSLLSLYTQEKRARHALDYDDLITHTLRLFNSPDTLGWVMSKLDYRIDHLLIDEAQDNSSAMWQLARILVEELIGSTGADLPRSVLVVGDEKQSIYSFQGAAPEQFERYQREFAQLLDGSASPLTIRTLDNSYRSANAILNFVNQACAEPAMASAIQASGISPPHQLIRTKAAGYVALHPPLIAPEKETNEPMTIPTEYRDATTAPRQLAEHIATTIDHWLNTEKRPITAGDILILVKNRAPLVQPLIQALQRRAIPVAGLDRLKLADHLAVKDILALMRWCSNINDDLSLAHVLRSPLIGWSDEQLRTAAFNRPGNLWNEIREPWLIQALSWKECSPYDFLTQTLEVTNRRRDFARRFGEEVHEILDELKAQAAAMPATLPPTIAHFTDWIATSAREIKREQEAATGNKLRIMTVHGAKGLEAPIVILADTVSAPSTSRERLFTLRSEHNQKLPVMSLSDTAKLAPKLQEAKKQKQAQLMAEYYRLFYVAITRPRDELHIFGTASKKGDIKPGTWYDLASSTMKNLNAENNNERLELRDPQTATPQPSAEPSTTNITLPTWINTTPQAPVAPALLVPSSIGHPTQQPSPYVAASGTGARERGVRIHRVLELLHANSDNKTILQLLHYLAPDWTETDRVKTAAEILKLFRQEQWLWQNTRAPEVSVAGTITYDGKPIAVSGTIDLLVETPDEIIIIDYKTGQNVPTTEAEVPLNYLLQLKTYQALISQIYHNKPVRCAILWTAATHLMWLDDQVKNAELKTHLAA